MILILILFFYNLCNVCFCSWMSFSLRSSDLDTCEVLLELSAWCEERDPENSCFTGRFIIPEIQCTFFVMILS